jgi:hypothetical protein
VNDSEAFRTSYEALDSTMLAERHLQAFLAHNADSYGTCHRCHCGLRLMTEPRTCFGRKTRTYEQAIIIFRYIMLLWSSVIGWWGVRLTSGVTTC